MSEHPRTAIQTFVLSLVPQVDFFHRTCQPQGLQQLKVLGLLKVFENSADWALLSSFCDDSNLRMSMFKYVALTTVGVSKESIDTLFNRKSISRKITHPQS